MTQAVILIYYLRKEGCKTLDELEEKTLQADTYYQNEHRFDSEVLLVKREENMKLSEGRIRGTFSCIED